MRIQNNVPALNAHRYYGINQAGVTKSIAKLSSGYRINSAADDAAGLAISEKMRAQIRGLTMASKNTQDGISLIQTAEGGMQEIDNMVQRIRELVVYASNDTQDQATAIASEGDRRKIQDEIDALTKEIDSMANRVEFNQKKLVSGDFVGGTDTQRQAYAAAAKNLNTARQIAIDYATGDSWSKAVADIKTLAEANTEKTNGASVTAANKFVTDVEELFGNALKGTTMPGVAQYTEKMVAAVSLLSATMTGWTTTAYTPTGTDGSVTALNAATVSATLASALGTNTGTIATPTASPVTVSGVADAISNVVLRAWQLEEAKSTVENSSVGKLYFQVGANAAQGIETSIGSVDTNMLGIGDGYGKSLIDVMETTGKQTTYQLSILDSALTYVTSERSKLGALQNRLEYTQSSLDISTENLTNAESRIRDVDMAKEMTQFTKMNILFQASTAMLAQANALPQGVLQMLG
jgi:flagellin